MESAGAKAELEIQWATDKQEQRTGFVWKGGVIETEERIGTGLSRL